jgi:hypothetical protein
MQEGLSCKRCGAEITLAGLKPGDTVQCLKCGALNAVPSERGSPDYGRVGSTGAGPPTGAGRGRASQGATSGMRPPGYLGPRTLGPFFEDTFRTYGADFLKFLAIVAIPQLVIFGFSFALAALSGIGMGLAMDLKPLAFAAMIPLILVMIVVVGVLSLLMKAALVHAVCHLYITRSIDIGKAYSFAWSRLLRLIGAVLLVVLIMAALAFVGVGIAMLLGMAPGGGFLAGFVWFLVMCCFAYLGIRFIFVEHAVLLDGCGAVAALGRSGDIVRGHWWRIFGIVLLMGLLVFVATMIVALPLSFVAGPVGTIVIQVLAAPLLGILTTLLYLDIRVRKEGYKLEELASALGIRV